jgi:putative transposase
MPRCARIVIPGLPHHITQRGNYRQKIFHRAEDYRLYLQLLTEFARHTGVGVHAYALMPNHVHVVAVPRDRQGLSKLFQRVHGEYARAIHLRLRRTGHLFQARYHSVALDPEHYWASMVYVERNPVEAGLVTRAEEWRWSSARAHLSGVDEGLLDVVEFRERYTGERWKSRLELGLRDAALVERLREGTRAGRPMGSAEFLDRLENDFRVAARAGRRGRPTSHAHAAS